MIHIQGLIKDYPNIRAVDHLDLEVNEGEFFAFLGPNGAGKSTTINMCTTLLKPTEGSIKINGYNMGKDDEIIRKSIGVVFQYSFLDDYLTVKENMRIRASFYDLSKAEFNNKYQELNELIGLDEIANKRYGTCSGGQKRRADIARALINSPKLLFLDEPTTGLDPQTRKRVWDVIKRLNREKKMTIFLTTHYMEEAEKADRVAIIDHGKLVACDTPSQLKQTYTYGIVKIVPEDLAICMEILKTTNYVVKQRQDRLHIISNSTQDSFEILELLKSQIRSFEVVEGNMDDVFLAITGREIRKEQ
jgi:multidrug/hemolysin transport system ATP-binding protein